MTAAYHFTDDKVIQQGVTFAKRFLWKDAAGTPIDLTGYSARMQGRRSASSPDVLMEFSTELGSIVLGGVDGTIDLRLSAQETSAIEKGGVYDLELTSPGGVVTRLLEGTFEISREVTRG